MLGDRLQSAAAARGLKLQLFTADFLPKMPDESLIIHPELVTEKNPRLRRYLVNVIVSRAEQSDHPVDAAGESGAPVVREDHPTLTNLLGRIEYISQMGALVTDFALIQPGALHKANDGYLVVDAQNVLLQPFAWEALTRALRNGYIDIESPAEQLGLAQTISLEPDPIPLTVKVVMIGERLLYYLLSEFDPDFQKLFKVQVDFEEETVRSPENALLFARLIAATVHNQKLKAFDAQAVARLIDESSRLADDSERMSLRIGQINDIVREADHWAGEAASQTVGRQHVERAIAERIRRADRVREKSQEAITRGIVLVDTQGTQVGQVNGLSLVSIGDLRFGRPTRITARVRMGTGKVVDIEREVELGGRLHSKGVLILSSFLATRYALSEPASLWASLVFEQSYAGVEGDSASSAELCALLSALAEVPLRQSIALTGSVNQMGDVQAIGGVNEKIEGFFDTCKIRGLTGDQGVVTPASNVKHLMLRPDLVAAVGQSKFHVYAVHTIDEAIEILTGRSAGQRDGGGKFPVGSINALVEEKLISYTRARRRFGLAVPTDPEVTRADG